MKSNWPEAAKKLAASILRTEQLKKLKGGLEYSRTFEVFDARYGELRSRSRALKLYSPKKWLDLAGGDLSAATINWCDGKERGLINRAFGLGRVRPAEAGDLNHPVMTDDQQMLLSEQADSSYSASVEEAGDGKSRLILKSGSIEVRFLIDTVRHVVISIETRDNGKAIGSVKFDDFVEVAGGWWARKVENLDAKGKTTSRACDRPSRIVVG